jgi:hypothetical protein
VQGIVDGVAGEVTVEAGTTVGSSTPTGREGTLSVEQAENNNANKKYEILIKIFVMLLFLMRQRILKLLE